MLLRVLLSLLLFSLLTPTDTASAQEARYSAFGSKITDLRERRENIWPICILVLILIPRGSARFIIANQLCTVTMIFLIARSTNVCLLTGKYVHL